MARIAGKMADDTSNNNSLRKGGNGNPGFYMLDSLYYDYARDNGGEV
ncbi:MAG: hypothetical protein RTV72_07445 [Candidatus Thorarchaeota archaeon]